MILQLKNQMIKLKSPIMRWINIKYYSVGGNEERTASLQWYSRKIVLPGSSHKETDKPIGGTFYKMTTLQSLEISKW